MSLKLNLMSLLLLCATGGAFGAAEVIKIDKKSSLVAVSAGNRPWKVGDYACVIQGDEEVACGSIIKATSKGAIVKFDFVSEKEVSAGDEVQLSNPPEKNAAKSANPPPAAATGSSDEIAKAKEEVARLKEETIRAKEEALKAKEELLRQKEEAFKAQTLESPPAPSPVQKPADPVDKDLQKIAEITKAPPTPTPPPKAPEPKTEKEVFDKLRADTGTTNSSSGEMRKLKTPKKVVVEETVDLGAMDKSAAKKASSTHANPHAAMGISTKPKFRVLYDVMLSYKPGNTVATTFEAYHNVLMLEIRPSRDVFFGFEVATTPRYFELDYQVSRKILLRIGKIYVPFDDLSPHSFFGGRANVTKLIPTGGTNFLPDLWTDLGVGLRWGLINTRRTRVDWDFYVMNGFQDSGTDPLAIETAYPDFSQTSVTTDNNLDKALGTRFHMDLFQRLLGMGFSFYKCRYSAQEKGDAGLWMVGLDGQLRLGAVEIRGGYTYMNVGLLSGDNFVRAGMYGEIGYQMSPQWKLLGRAGQSQNDNRVIAVTDQLVVGGSLLYRPGPVQLSVELSHDLHRLDGKNSYTFLAFRVMTLF